MPATAQRAIDTGQPLRNTAREANSSSMVGRHVQGNNGVSAAIGAPTMFIVDDDPDSRATMSETLQDHGYLVECFSDCAGFLDSFRTGQLGCLLIDARSPMMSGIELIEHLKFHGEDLPVIMLSGDADVSTAVRAMKAGAVDFIEKPLSGARLLRSIDQALRPVRFSAKDSGKAPGVRSTAARCVASLTKRQHEILEFVLAGHPSKNIAADLHISQRTVENHRAAIMRKTGSVSVPHLVRTALLAE